MKQYGTGFATGIAETAPTETTQNEQESVHEGYIHNPLDYAQETVDELASSSVFIESGLQKNYDMSSTSTDDYLYLLANFTNDYLQENKDYFLENYGQETVESIRLHGMAPYAMRQKSLLLNAEQTGMPLSREAKNHAKDTAIQFNQTLLALIDSNPSRNINDLSNSISIAASRYDAASTAQINDTINSTVRGMRTEYTFQRVVEASGLVEIRHATAKEDRKGIDFIITTPDGKQLKIDIKSSFNSILNKSRDGDVDINSPYTKTRDGNFIYHPLVKDSMFKNNSFLLSKDAAAEFTMPILGNIQKMALETS